MEALEIFFLSIAIGLIVHLLVRWSERQKSRGAEDASQQSSQTTGESALGSALGEVERELRKSLSDESDTSRCADDATACASCTDSCSEAERAIRRAPRIVYYDDEELDVLAHRPIESYTDAELAMLREVAETLLETDYEGWLKSLSMRGILLPPEILQLVTP
ncbi:MAG: hypothetical protein JNG44_04835 [Porphyromonas sp.]|uniref:hypothetical protein n=1 Tax=Porphyromonas sp. TaxID=1924944 RepID=UPI001A5B5118|nr:hypothetical protein [Porphyromonas sp.]MBL6453002.1 hypothetical protein [Porphyromonas sp.]